MKIRMYLDTFRGDEFQYTTAFTNPSRKTKSSTRIAFDVDIPDKVLDQINGVDEALHMTSKVIDVDLAE